MKVIHIDLSENLDNIEVVGFGDLHDGDPMCSLGDIKNTVEYVLAKPNRYCILNGDLVNMALKHSVSDVYGEERSPMLQIHHITEVLKPLKEGDRILALLPGNHEERSYKDAGLDTGELIAMDLGILDRYARNTALVFVSLGKSVNHTSKRPKKNVYSIYVNHGFGGGRSVGSKLNKVKLLDEVVDADLYLMGHVHLAATTKLDYYRLDYQNKTMKQVTRSYMIHNAWLKFGGYGERFGFAPSTITISKATLNGKGQKHVSLTI